MITHLFISALLLTIFLLGTTSDKSEKFYIIGGLCGCLFFTHITMLTLMKVVGLI